MIVASKRGTRHGPRQRNSSYGTDEPDALPFKTTLVCRFGWTVVCSRVLGTQVDLSRTSLSSHLNVAYG